MNGIHTTARLDEEPRHIEPDWIDTPTSKKIEDALLYVQETPTIGLIYGGAGLGKTHTATRYFNQRKRKHEGGVQSCRPAVYMVTAHPGMGTVAAALSAISEAVGRTGDAYRNDAMTRQILQSVNPGDLLLLDEAQHFDIKALDLIRHLHDVGGIGVAYLGNEEIQTRISGRGRQAAFLGPLVSRVGFRLHVQHPTDGDVAALLKAWGIHGETEAEYGKTIGMSRVGLRGLTQVLRQSALIAQELERSIDVEVMVTTAKLLGFD